MKGSTILMFAIALSLMAGNAYAYLDPGTGSVILQIIVASLVGSAVAIKMYWQRVKAFFARLVSSSRANKEKAPDNDS